MAEATEQPVALIGGISGGIGSRLARHLTERGWRVAGFARDEDKLSDLRENCPEAETDTADATDSEAVEAQVSRVVEAHGRLDGYAHCVGSIVISPLNQVKEEVWEKTLRLNLTSAFYALKAVSPVMAKARQGSIAFMSTVAAVRGIPNHEAIAAAKAGLDGMMRAAAASLANRNVRLNSVAPALVDTPLSQPFISSEQAQEAVKKMNPMGAIMDPASVASLLAWLLSDDARHVNGQTFGYDGGLATLTQRPKL